MHGLLTALGVLGPLTRLQNINFNETPLFCDPNFEKGKVFFFRGNQSERNLGQWPLRKHQQIITTTKTTTIIFNLLKFICDFCFASLFMFSFLWLLVACSCGGKGQHDVCSWKCIAGKKTPPSTTTTESGNNKMYLNYSHVK